MRVWCSRAAETEEAFQTRGLHAQSPSSWRKQSTAARSHGSRGCLPAKSVFFSRMSSIIAQRGILTGPLRPRQPSITRLYGCFSQRGYLQAVSHIYQKTVLEESSQYSPPWECAPRLEWVGKGGQTSASLQDVDRAGRARRNHPATLPAACSPRQWDLDVETPRKGCAGGPKQGLGKQVTLPPNSTAASMG